MEQMRFGHTGRRLRLVALAAVALMPVLVAPGSAAPDDAYVLARAEVAAPERPVQPMQPGASEMFSDAPYGVDPVVTGPVSAAFRERQERLRCDDAKWPNVPRGCYPD